MYLQNSLNCLTTQFRYDYKKVENSCNCHQSSPYKHTCCWYISLKHQS
jgi:hypothetical protein